MSNWPPTHAPFFIFLGAKEKQMPDEIESEENGKKFYFFKHNNVAHFKVGKYEFLNHMATVRAEDLDDFLKTSEGLAPIDKNAIEQVLEIRNTRPLAELRSRVVRDELGTKDIVDSTKVAPAGQSTAEDSVAKAPAPSLLGALARNANQSAT